MTFAYCILCPDTFQSEEEALKHFAEKKHGWSRTWKHGFDGRAEEESKRKKDGRRARHQSQEGGNAK